jgi:hypothetical protein
MSIFYFDSLSKSMSKSFLSPPYLYSSASMAFFVFQPAAAKAGIVTSDFILFGNRTAFFFA